MIVYVAQEVDDIERLTFDANPACYASHRLAKPNDLAIAAVAEFLDQDAENCNAHDFAGVHKKLAALLIQIVGRKNAKEVMTRLCAYQGLHGIDGVAGCGDDKLSAELDSVVL